MTPNPLPLFLVLVFTCFFASAQHPLVGTWEMTSITGVSADDQKFQLDSTTIRETKIITPTHYILIATDKEDGTWKFNRCYFGSVKFKGDKYYEIPIMSSEQIYENVKTDFHWKIDGNHFIQSGSIIRPDGKKIKLERFLFRRSEVSAVADKKFTGTWKTEQDGMKSYLVITPTHWMIIEKREQKFSKAMGGTYKLAGDAAELDMLYGTEASKRVKAELKGGQVVVEGVGYSKVN